MLAASADETAAMLATYDAFGREMGQRGVLRGGERLRRPPTRPASGLSRLTSKIPRPGRARSR